MGSQNSGSEREQFTRRGWLPQAGVIGNVLVIPLDPDLAYRLREAFELDPWSRLKVAGGVHDIGRECVSEVLSQ